MSIKDPHHPNSNPLAQAKDPLDIGSTWKAKTEEVVKNNAAKISTAEILENKNYLRYNVCSDGRGIQEGVASLGGSAGTLLAMYCSLKEVFKDCDPEKIVKIMKEFVGDIKIYLHDDVHTQNHNNGQHPCDCHNIGCGAVDLLLKNNNIATNENDNIGLNTKEKSLRRNFLKENSQLTILEGEHREESIIRIKKETTQQDDKMGENQNTIPIYIYIQSTHKKEDGRQDFVFNEAGIHLIISRMSEDMSKQLLQELGNNELQKYCTTFSDDSTNLTEEQIIQDITQQLTQKTKTRIHKHATFILSNLGPAKKLVEKERIYYVQ